MLATIVGIVVGGLSGVLIGMFGMEGGTHLRGGAEPSASLFALLLVGGWAVSAYANRRGAPTPWTVVKRTGVLGAVEWLLLGMWALAAPRFALIHAPSLVLSALMASLTVAYVGHSRAEAAEFARRLHERKQLSDEARALRHGAVE